MRGLYRPITEGFMAQSGYKNGLKRTPKGFWAYKIRVGRQTKEGTFPTTQLQTARKLLERTRDDLLRQQEGLEIELTVGEAMDYWLESSYARAKHLDRANYAFDRIRPVLGSAEIRRLTPASIIAFKQELLNPKEGSARSLMPSTVNILLRYLAMAINWAVKNRKIEKNPLQKAMPYEPDSEDNRPLLVRDELIPFLMKVDTYGNEHQCVAIRAMLLMGLRECEALRLRWDGFSSDWAFYAPARSKNGKAQNVPVAAEVRRAVMALPRVSEWVLPGRAGSLHLKGYTRETVAQAGTEIGKPGLTPHRLRASCATIHAARGVNAFQIRDLLRHERIATSQRYVQLVPVNLQIVVEQTFEGVTEMFTKVVPIIPEPTTVDVNQIDPPADMNGEPTR